MEVNVKEVTYAKSFESKFGQLHSFKMRVIDPEGNEIVGFYNTNDKGFKADTKEQKRFKEGEKAEVTLHQMNSNGKAWYKIKPEQKGGGFSKYNQSLRREQARYSSFSYAYTKDLIVAGKLDIKKWHDAAKKAAKGMLEIDKELDDNS